MTFPEELKDLLSGRSTWSRSQMPQFIRWVFQFSGRRSARGFELHQGRRMLSRLGVLIMIASVFVWADLAPDTHELSQRARAIVAEFPTAVAPLALAAVLR